MSRELEELREIARREREKSWRHVRALPRRTSEVASAVASAHPFLTTAAAAAIAMSLVPKGNSNGGNSNGGKSSGGSVDGQDAVGTRGALSGIVMSLGLRMLPDLLRLALGASSAPQSTDEAASSSPGGESTTPTPSRAPKAGAPVSS